MCSLRAWREHTMSLFHWDPQRIEGLCLSIWCLCRPWLLSVVTHNFRLWNVIFPRCAASLSVPHSAARCLFKIGCFGYVAARCLCIAEGLIHFHKMQKQVLWDIQNEGFIICIGAYCRRENKKYLSLEKSDTPLNNNMLP